MCLLFGSRGTKFFPGLLKGPSIWNPCTKSQDTLFGKQTPEFYQGLSATLAGRCVLIPHQVLRLKFWLVNQDITYIVKMLDIRGVLYSDQSTGGKWQGSLATSWRGLKGGHAMEIYISLGSWLPVV